MCPCLRLVRLSWILLIEPCSVELISLTQNETNIKSQRSLTTLRDIISHFDGASEASKINFDALNSFCCISRENSGETRSRLSASRLLPSRFKISKCFCYSECSHFIRREYDRFLNIKADHGWYRHFNISRLKSRDISSAVND